jgi:hypothetical protein
MHPLLRKNGANPIDSECAELIANFLAGKRVTLSDWSGLTHVMSMMLRVRLACLVEPSHSGW